MSADRHRAGTFKRVTSLTNPLVKDIRAPHLKKHRDAAGLFIAEGRKLVRDAVEGGWPVHTLVYAAALASDPAVTAVAAEVKAAGGTVLEVSAPVLEKIARRDNPQSVIGVFPQRFATSPAFGCDGIWVALDRVRDPGNLGTIIRTADAAGLAGVVLVGACCDPFALEAVRATMGSIFHVPLARLTEDALVAQANRQDARLIGAHLTAGAVDYREASYRRPLILLMGNEQQGLTDRLSAACDELVRIPMRGKADSLNLAVSTGLMIYEARRTEEHA